MSNKVTVNRLKLIAAFIPPKIKRGAKSVPKTSIITYENGCLMIEGAFITIGVECSSGGWNKQLEVRTAVIYQNLLNFPKTEEVEVSLEDEKLCFRADKFSLTCPIVKT